MLDEQECNSARSRALALYGDGLLAFWQGNVDASRERSEASLVAAETANDPEALALAHLGVSRAVFESGNHEQAAHHAIQARDHARDLAPAMSQAPLHMHAQATRLAGDYDKAADLFEKSLELNRRIGDEGMVLVELHNLGHVEIRRGNVDAAERYFEECATTGDADDPYGMAMTTLNQAVVAFARSDLTLARTLMDRIDSIFQEAEMEPAADDRAEIESLRRRLADASR